MGMSLDQVDVQRSVEKGQGAQVDTKDVELAFRMGVKLMSSGGMKVIKDAINQSQDPAQVVGQVLAQIMSKLAEGLQEKYDIDPSIFLAKGGWLDLMLDYIEKQLGYPSDFSDQIYQQVVEVIKAAASGPDAPNNVMELGQDGGPESAEGTSPEDAALAQQNAQQAPPPEQQQGPPQGGGLQGVA